MVFAMVMGIGALMLYGLGCWQEHTQPSAEEQERWRRLWDGATVRDRR